MQSTLFHASRHVSDAELHPPLVRCTFCGSEALRPTGIVIQRAPDIELLACDACGIRTVSRLPTDDALDAYYASYYAPDAAERTTFDETPRFGRHLAALARRAGLAVDAPLRVLDLGGGDGSIALALLDALGVTEAEVVVVDSVPLACPARAGWSIAQAETLDEAEGVFSIVLASAILEHLPLPGDALDACLDRVAPGGLFYARTPWIEPLRRVLPGLDFCFPGHLHDMGAAFWDRGAANRSDRVRVLASRPSIVENSLQAHPLRALAAWTLKLPAHVEVRLRGKGSGRVRWGFTGGWEVAWVATTAG
jgi:SAM-dependent methyltransferase